MGQLGAAWGPRRLISFCVFSVRATRGQIDGLNPEGQISLRHRGRSRDAYWGRIELDHGSRLEAAVPPASRPERFNRLTRSANRGSERSVSYFGSTLRNNKVSDRA